MEAVSMYSLGVCSLFQWHHTISSCEKQWSCHLLSVGFLAFCFPQLLGCTGRAMEVQAEAPRPSWAAFGPRWGLVAKPGVKSSPCMTITAVSMEPWASWARGPKDSFLFPQRNESMKSSHGPAAVRGGAGASVPVGEHSLSLLC